MALSEKLKFDEKGLVAVIAVDDANDEVLMFAFANAEAVDKTLETGKAHYWSRSRGELWLKGGTSGHVQTVREIRVDCDCDCLIYRIEQAGGACHLGYRSCFFRRVTELGELDVTAEKVFDPDEVY